jgi:hypothetical protein
MTEESTPKPDRRVSDALTVRLDLLREDIGDMKNAISQLATSVNRLAVVEERLGNTSQALERAFKALEKIEQRLNVLETTAVSSKKTNEWVDKAIYAGLAALAMYAAQRIGLFK